MYFSTSAGWHLYLNMECRNNWYNTGALARARRARRVGSQQPQAVPRRQLPTALMVRFDLFSPAHFHLVNICRCQWRRCDHQWRHKQRGGRWQWWGDGGELGLKQENYFGLERRLILDRKASFGWQSDIWIKSKTWVKIDLCVKPLPRMAKSVERRLKETYCSPAEVSRPTHLNLMTDVTQ